MLRKIGEHSRGNRKIKVQKGRGLLGSDFSTLLGA